MAEQYGPLSDVARKSHAEILRRLASAGQKPTADAIGKSETWVSRWKSEDSETCACLLAALGLKVVPAEHQCYDREHIEHLRYFAKLGMASEEPKALDWE